MQGTVSSHNMTLLSMCETINPSNAKAAKTVAKPCHVGIHKIVFTEYSQMSTHMPVVQSFSVFLRHFVLA